MKPFLGEDFLLESDVASDLYRRFAAGMPIIDYHCHLSPALMAADHRFATITELWLDGDHYKWRAMRSNGVPERFCTGDAGPWEKFEAWARTVPDTLRNPLYH
ncbi:MAG TPA: glucuronate isomerase, partial [Vicinamibacterales bacterium]|nr:glucuronate isomerase [Vicinamibacterales bacterium]